MTLTSLPSDKVLAIDAATRTQALALLDGDQLLETRAQRVRYNHGSALLANIEALFNAQSLDLSQVELFAVGLGPGSFTGLRVALAASKALARAHQRPIVGVSSLAAAALPLALSSPGQPVCVAFDARRHEVYAGAYVAREGRLLTLLPEDTRAPELLADELQTLDAPHPIALIGDGIRAYPALQELPADLVLRPPAPLAPPSAVGVALLARQHLATHGPHDLVQLEPNYIRPSDARLPTT
ncbi:tRNA (adenosine(37)-N6)-threonylcarbamoyltransferase complex dimerization subunit type 1 TsaB [Lujinxingia litoralis]|uniref:tRNA (Adenosine(37)-N6)-threonylcarbamoyltransferase complex dimerization subunit type 1 TsaB n=1 Tax=Lujinxingia litoralis TaxID=2211119 RepID=A0A328C597_9DELT|nr:tRNA (adenosine(37)-N6)-threonylcarbamoyltransferase complex dimerization subunit type 1 TsaB [Lujinxingia litoralis]RAL22741.1 tRNA (adenosine(37)-N6)-threonylcarbamoyltransferase complex dimerization subunit type 1 TsaB [Lujinxingia litoralis]